MLPAVKVGITALSVLVPLGMAYWDKRSEKTKFVSDRLYRGMQSGEFTDTDVVVLCKEFDIPYPPSSMPESYYARSKATALTST